MGMFNLWKCPRCWDSPCRCETDAHGDPVNHPNNGYQRRQLELAEERNQLLRDIAKRSPEKDNNG